MINHGKKLKLCQTVKNSVITRYQLEFEQPNINLKASENFIDDLLIEGKIFHLQKIHFKEQNRYTYMRYFIRNEFKGKI